MAKTISGMDPKGKEKILARLRSAEGHVRGVIEMVRKDEYCIDVIRQTKAIQAAIDRVNALLLERHLSHCVSQAIRSDDATRRERVIGELLDVFEAGGRR